MPPRLLLALLVLASAPLAAQDAPVEIPPPRPGDFDARAFYAVYDIRNPVFERTMRVANGASLPIFFVVVPALGAGELIAGTSGAHAGRMVLSEAGALGLVFLGKNLLERPRPYVALGDVTPRQRHPPSGRDPYSFPSGHSAMAFAVATSASLSYSKWYVIVPAYTWASATALARVWYGMHYPTDVVVGAAVGAGAAVLVHVLFSGDSDSTGEGLPAEAVVPTEAVVPAFSFRIGL